MKYARNRKLNDPVLGSVIHPATSLRPARTRTQERNTHTLAAQAYVHTYIQANKQTNKQINAITYDT